MTAPAHGSGSRFEKAFAAWRNPSWWMMLIAFPWMIGVLFLAGSCIRDRTIASRERTVRGTITVHQPSNHDRYGYSFAVRGRNYSGWEIPREKSYEIGQEVTVFYDREDPDTNALTEFAELGEETAGPVPLLLVGIGALAVFIYRRRLTVREDSRPRSGR